MLFFINFFCIFISLHVYKNIWIYLKINKTPTGAGIIFLISLLVNIYLNNESFSSELKIAFSLISVLTLIYYIDDLISLSVAVRIIIQILLGIIITTTFFSNLFIENSYFFIIILTCILILSLLLTNTINFYDGADLNIVFFGVLNFLILSFVFSLDKNIQILIHLSLVFFIAFSLLNYKANSLYFGDAGSFFLAGLFLIFISLAAVMQNLKIYYLLTTLCLPILDVIYVILYRLIRKEPLHTRHYYQIYQLAQRTQRKWLYLLIQPINTVFSLLSIFFLCSLGLNETVSIITGSSLISIIFYFSLRNFLMNAKK